MYLARGEFEWDQTSQIVAMLHNVNCAKKSDMVIPGDLNPYATKSLSKKKSPHDDVILVPASTFKDLFPQRK